MKIWLSRFYTLYQDKLKVGLPFEFQQYLRLYNTTVSSNKRQTLSKHVCYDESPISFNNKKVLFLTNEDHLRPHWKFNRVLTSFIFSISNPDQNLKKKYFNLIKSFLINQGKQWKTEIVFSRSDFLGRIMIHVQ